MCSSPFVFFRGSSQLFYADLAARHLPTPEPFETVPLTTIMGDCHTSNFGFFTEQGSFGEQIVFSINDFDDACLGHAYWDIIRFAVSLFLAMDHCQGLQKKPGEADSKQRPNANSSKLKDHSHKPVVDAEHVRVAIKEFIEAYCSVVADVLDVKGNKLSVLNKRFCDFTTPSPLKKRYKKACSVALGGELFLSKSSLAKAIDMTELPPQFASKPEKFTRENIDISQIKKRYSPYFYDYILDVVGRINSGTGSVNMGRYYLLLGPLNIQTVADLYHCHVVEVKQQRVAAPIAYFPDLHHQNKLNPAHLTVKCQRRMQSSIDYCLDEAYFKGEHWLIRSRHHAKVGIDPEHIGLGKVNVEQGGFAFYAKACGIELARAHCRADRSSIAFEKAIIGVLRATSEEIESIAFNYAEQVKQDWQWLCEQQPTQTDV
jgi:hypothetical protein